MGFFIVAFGLDQGGVDTSEVPLIGQEPEEGVEGLRPIRLNGKNVRVQIPGLGSLALGLKQTGGPEQGLKVGTVAFAHNCRAGANCLEDRGALCPYIGDGLVHALFAEDASHLLKNVRAGAAALDLGKGGG